MQRRLPQVIVGNERLLRIRDLATVEAQVPDNVYIVRQKSSWLNEMLFIRVLRWLACALESERSSTDVVLILDCASVHLTPKVWIAARKVGIELVYVPRKLTWVRTLHVTGKITTSVAESEFLRLTHGAERNIRELMFVEQRKKERMLRVRQELDRAAVASASKPFIAIPAVEAWLLLFQTVRDRYPFLVLDGPSCLGKTRFSKALTQPSRFLYCDCSNGNPPDMRSFQCWITMLCSWTRCLLRKPSSTRNCYKPVLTSASSVVPRRSSIPTRCMSLGFAL